MNKQNLVESLPRRGEAVVAASNIPYGCNIHVPTNIWPCNISCPLSFSAKLSLEAIIQSAETHFSPPTACLSICSSASVCVTELQEPAAITTWTKWDFQHFLNYHGAAVAIHLIPLQFLRSNPIKVDGVGRGGITAAKYAPQFSQK